MLPVKLLVDTFQLICIITEGEGRLQRKVCGMILFFATQYIWEIWMKNNYLLYVMFQKHYFKYFICIISLHLYNSNGNC